MIDINIQLSQLDGNNLIYVVAGFGGVVLTSIGGVLMRCVLNKRKRDRRIKNYENEIKSATEKVIQETIAKNNRLQQIKKEDLEPVTVKAVEPVKQMGCFWFLIRLKRRKKPRLAKLFDIESDDEVVIYRTEGLRKRKPFFQKG